MYADATYPYSRTGQLAAEWEIAQTGGKVNSVVQQFAGQPPSDATAAGWNAALKQYCPSTCSSSNDNVTFGAQTVQEIQSGTQVAAQNPQVNAIFPVYDYQMAYMLPELTAASASSRIDLLSENADLAQMQELKQGTSVKVDVGNPVEWDGWAAVDEALRALKGLPGGQGRAAARAHVRHRQHHVDRPHGQPRLLVRRGQLPGRLREAVGRHRRLAAALTSQRQCQRQ